MIVIVKYLYHIGKICRIYFNTYSLIFFCFVNKTTGNKLLYISAFKNKNQCGNWNNLFNLKTKLRPFASSDTILFEFLMLILTVATVKTNWTIVASLNKKCRLKAMNRHVGCLITRMNFKIFLWHNQHFV